MRILFGLLPRPDISPRQTRQRGDGFYIHAERTKGFEPSTLCLEGRRSNALSYIR